ncbi:hypothetical protein K504DRAFT_391929, partial [Pleomassaria siparia CBS 279.74]
KTVALSSCEAEYIAYKDAVKESIYLNNILNSIFKDIKQLLNSTNILLTNSKSVIELARNPIYYA